MQLDTKTLLLTSLISSIGTLFVISILMFSSGSPTGYFFLWDMFDDPEEGFEGEFMEHDPEEEWVEEEFPHEEPYMEEGYEEEHHPEEEWINEEWNEEEEFPEEEFPEGEWFEDEFFPEGLTPEMIAEMEIISGLSEPEEEETPEESSSGSSTKTLTQPTMPTGMSSNHFITAWEMIGETCAITASNAKTQTGGSGYCEVYCSSGKRILGGGFGDIGVTTSVLENGPIFKNGLYGWQAWLSSENMIPGDFSVYAICGKVDTTISSS